MNRVVLAAFLVAAGVAGVRTLRGEEGGAGAATTAAAGLGPGSAVGAAGLISYDDFGPASELNELDTGIGWNSFWGTHDPDAFNVSNVDPMAYLDLKVNGGYGIDTGPRDDGESGHAGRLLDWSVNGPYVDFLAGDGKAIGKAGTTLWLSCLLEKDEDNDNAVRVSLARVRDEHVPFLDFGFEISHWHIGYFGPVGQGDGKLKKAATSGAATAAVMAPLRYWGMEYVGMDGHANVVYSKQPILVHAAALLVLKMQYLKGDKETDGLLSLWVNPDSIGGDEPANPDVVGKVRDVTFNDFLWNGAKTNRIGEIRIGTSYGAVTPRDLPVGDAATKP